MSYLIDTNIIVHFVRKSIRYEQLEKNIPLFSNNLDVYFSEVSVGEILSISQRSRWGNKKIERVKTLLDTLTLIPISYPDIYRAYATIDAYDQSKYPTLSLPQGMTARNMGKTIFELSLPRTYYAPHSSPQIRILTTWNTFLVWNGWSNKFEYDR